MAEPTWSKLKSTMLKEPSIDDIMQGGDAPTILAALGNGTNNTRTPQTIAQTDAPPSPASIGSPDPAALPSAPTQNTSQDSSKDGTVMNRKHRIDPLQDARDRASIEAQPWAQNQSKSIKDYTDLINMQANQPTQTNLSGLMGMADVLSNGKYGLQAGYKAPQSGADKLKALLPYMDKAQDNRRDYNKQITDAVKNLYDGVDVTTHQDTTGDKSTEGGKMATPRDALSWNNSLEKTLGATRQAASGAAEALQMLRSNTPVADKEFKPGFLRALGLMRITNQELNNTSGGKSISDRLDQMVSDADTGKITDTNRGQYIDIMQGIAKNIRAAHGEAMKRFELSGKNLAHIPAADVDTQIGAASKIHALDSMDMSPFKPGAQASGNKTASNAKTLTQEEFHALSPAEQDALMKGAH